MDRGEIPIEPGDSWFSSKLLGQNFAWLVKSVDAAKKAGIELPQGENKIKTNYIR